MLMSLRLEDLEVWTRIGVPEIERAKPQKLLVSLQFSIAPPQSDEIGATINYAIVAEQIQHFAKTHSYQLLESFNQNLADFLQKKFSITKLKLTIKKFILPDCRWVAITLKL